MKKKASDETIDITEIPTQSFYADKIIGMGLGVSVSKLILGNEVSPGNHTPTLNLIMPTTALLDALNSLQKTIHEDDGYKALLLEQIDKIKEQYSNL